MKGADKFQVGELTVAPPCVGARRVARVPLVYVVVLHYGDWQSTQQCFGTLKRLDYPNSQVLLINNSSNNLAFWELTELVPQVELLNNACNLGFAGGSNQGVCMALRRGAEYVWLLNNDVKVEPRALTAMVVEAEADPRVGAVGSLLVNDDPGRKLLAWGGGRISFLLGLPRHVRIGRPTSLHYLCGASLLLRAQAIQDVGLFDEGYFLYWEDTDLCFRLRAKGWRLAVAEGSVVAHQESGSLGFQSASYDYHFTRSSMRFFRRHSQCWLWPSIISVSGRMLRRALAGAWENVCAVWKGFLEGIAMTPFSDRA